MQASFINKIKTALLVLAATIIGSGTVGAATMTVNTFTDEVVTNSSCSLREAIINANNNDTSGSADCAAGEATAVDEIVLAAGSYNLSIVGRGEDAALTGDLDITDVSSTGASLVITGATDGASGAPTTIIDGGDIDRIFDIFNPLNKDNLDQGASFDGVIVTMQNLKLINGHAEETVVAVDNQANGGAIFSWRFNNLIIINSEFDNNQAVWDLKYDVIDPDTIPDSGDEIEERTLSGHGGAVYSRGQLVVQGSVFSNNMAYTTYDENGDSVIEGENEKNGNGGGIFVAFPSTIENSTFSNNTASNGGGINTTGGDPAIEPGNMTVSGSTFVGNWAVMGGGINNVSPQVKLDIINTTFSANTTTDMGGGINSDAAVHLKHVTVVDNEVINSDKHGAGINYFGPAGEFFLSNTLLSNNKGSKSVINCGCTGGTILACSTLDVTSMGGNVSSDFNCGLNSALNDLQGPDPKVLPLADNGGLTWTHALRYDSLAIDAGKDTNCVSAAPAILADQRGVARPVDGNSDGVAACDTGAYERQLANTDILLTGIDLSAYEVTVDDELVITVSAANTGPGIASDGRVDVVMPAGVNIVSAEVVGAAACSMRGSIVACELGDMVALSSFNIEISATALSEGTMNIAATVSALEVDNNADNNFLEAALTVKAKPIFVSSSDSGGFCSYQADGRLDLVLPAIVLFALSYLAWRRRRS